MQWCSTHVPKCAFDLGPLHARKSQGFVGPPSEEELDCFNRLKDWLTSEEGPLLALPNFFSYFLFLPFDLEHAFWPFTADVEHDDVKDALEAVANDLVVDITTTV